MDKYYKNFILCDSVLYYCFLCDEQFTGIPMVEKHIRWENHRKRLKNQAYFPKFRKDCIYKVDKYFYCEVCNFVLSDVAAGAITEHINNDPHKAMENNPKRETKIIGQFESGFIIINKMKIEMAQWHSILEQKCLICDTEVTDIKLHVGLKEHIVNMVKSEMICEDNRYFRKINNNKYHCLNSRKVVDALNRTNKNIDKPTKDEAKVEEKLDKRIAALQEFFLVDLKNNTATCKKCKSLTEVTFRNMLEHISIHYDGGMKLDLDSEHDPIPNITESLEKEIVYCKIIDHGKQRSELAKYGKENSIKLNFNGSKGWCMVCDRYLSTHMNVFKQHIQGATHQGNLELQGVISLKKHDTKEIRTKSILQCRLEYLFEDHEFYVLDYLSIDIFSFFLICQIEDPHFKKTKCYACNELFPQGQEREHCSSLKHKKKFLAAKFVMLFEEVGQFIREIRRNYFHCGFCNQTIPYLEQIFAHKSSLSHKMKQIAKTGICGVTVTFNTKSEDVYTKLLHYGFGKNNN